VELTLAMIKPDGVRRNLLGKIIDRVEAAGLSVAAMRLAHLSKREAEGFYAVHRARPFFASLTDYMCSGPVVLLALRGENAIRRWRDLMGATDPVKAAPGTIRKEFGESIECNTTHGSDAPDTARFEVGYFFNALEIVR